MGKKMFLNYATTILINAQILISKVTTSFVLKICSKAKTIYILSPEIPKSHVWKVPAHGTWLSNYLMALFKG